MKQLAFLFLLAIPAISFAQTKDDYEHVAGRFMRFYNGNQSDSIRLMFSDEWGETKSDIWDKEQTDKLKRQYGNIVSYRYLELYKHGVQDGDEDGLAMFKLVTTKSTHIMSMSLDLKNEMLTFRFKDPAKHADSVLAKNR